MKKILMIAALAATMASCTSEEPSQVSDSYAIGFKTFVGKATRAGDVDTQSLTKFVVYGGTDKLEFDGVQVSKTNDVWSYSPLKYWTEGSKYNFAAVAPEVENASFSAKKLTIANYTPGETDLIVAASNEITGAAVGSNQLVTLNFKHALAKVQFTFVGDVANVSDVKLTSVSNKANLEVSYSEGTTATWGESAGTGDYSYTIVEGKGVKYLLPQAIGDNVKVSYKFNEKEYTLNMKTDVVGAWEMGKAYNYTISLASDAIGFEVVEAAAWTTTELVPAENTTEEPGEEPGEEPKEDEPVEEPAIGEPTTQIIVSYGSTWIRSTNTGADYSNQGAMEIQSREDGTRFFGLIGFNLPENLEYSGYKLTATLRLVTTQCKGDRMIDLYDFNQEFVMSGATYDKYGADCESIIEANNPVASFKAEGQGTKAITDGGLDETYQTASAWANQVDITDLVNSKNGGSALNLIITKQNNHNDSFKFATERIGNLVNEKMDPNITFNGEDLVPQLVITYTKE